jgi:hypothetical protein
MAPATLAGATPQVRRTGVGWDRDSIISAIREWVATYGEPPRAADWNPASAKWSGQLWRVERYRSGRADGSPWPALNSAKRPFGNSLNEAIRAAGFEPAKPGPVRRRDVAPELADRAEMSPEGRAMVSAALARARAAERRVATLEAQLARAKPKAAVAAARMDAAQARTDAGRMAAKLERAEATIASLRGERRELKAERDRQADALVATERLLGAARAEAADRRAASAERELRETVAAIKGEQRRLTADELVELRSTGPAGPAVLATALKALATARANGSATDLRVALTEVARAAITWQERI